MNRSNGAAHAEPSVDMLDGYEEIGAFIGMTEVQARHRAKAGEIPTIKVGRRRYARHSTLLQWMDECESRSMHGPAREAPAVKRAAKQHRGKEDAWQAEALAGIENLLVQIIERLERLESCGANIREGANGKRR